MTLFLDFICHFFFTFPPIFMFPHRYVWSFMRGEGGDLALFTALSSTPKTGDTVRHSKYLLNGLNEGFASVISPVLRISEPAIEIKVSIPSTHHYQRFSAFVFTFGGNYSFDLHLFIVQIFHPLHDCRHSVLGWLVCTQRRSESFSAPLLISMTLTCFLQDL